MELKISNSSQDLPIDLDSAAALIANTQKASGEIPWCEDNKTDPWDLVEAAMGLSIGGYFEEAQRAFEWMVKNQLHDGSWYASYRDGLPDDTTKETNMSSYIAVGVFHYYLITGDTSFLKGMWETVSSAIEFALSLQTPNGEIYWSYNPEGEIDPMALLTGSSSIYMSIKCALAIADILNHSRPAWKKALKRLGDAIKYRPFLFDRTKSRFSMDWFYPILSGVFSGAEAQRRIESQWNKFVVMGMGVRCVSDEPWVTVAETSELSLTLTAMGHRKLSETIFNWIQDKRYEDGSYWCGVTFPDKIVWPEDKLTWTNAVVLMAADALYNLTPASQLFNHSFWNSSEFGSLNGALNIHEHIYSQGLYRGGIKV
jgi:hypothetical protein